MLPECSAHFELPVLTVGDNGDVIENRADVVGGNAAVVVEVVAAGASRRRSVHFEGEGEQGVQV